MADNLPVIAPSLSSGVGASVRGDGLVQGSSRFSAVERARRDARFAELKQAAGGSVPAPVTPAAPVAPSAPSRKEGKQSRDENFKALLKNAESAPSIPKRRNELPSNRELNALLDTVATIGKFDQSLGPKVDGFRLATPKMLVERNPEIAKALASSRLTGELPHRLATAEDVTMSALEIIAEGDKEQGTNNVQAFLAGFDGLSPAVQAAIIGEISLPPPAASKAATKEELAAFAAAGDAEALMVKLWGRDAYKHLGTVRHRIGRVEKAIPKALSELAHFLNAMGPNEAIAMYTLLVKGTTKRRAPRP